MSIAGQGVDKEQFEEVVGVLAERAFEDQCTTIIQSCRLFQN